jgi:dGTPase
MPPPAPGAPAALPPAPSSPPPSRSQSPLAHLAADPSRSRGRLHGEDDRTNRGPRDAFQRDRDRIVHSIPFRRLRHKTQVFVAPDGDHFRVRLTHSLEVAQIGRTMARALGLNEDLTEALCLAHDIGHPPFGHAGEDALEGAMAGAGGFDHNAHTIRLLTRLESPYPRFAGLNLSWETLEGLAKHNGPVADPPWALAEADGEFPLELVTWPGLEAQVAAIADDIAYDNHDIDDGLRAGLFSLDDLLEVPLVAREWAAVKARFPGFPEARLVPELVRDLIGLMVNDVLAETLRRAGGLSDADAVRAAGRPLAGFSDALAGEERALKAFLHERMYDAPEVQAVRDEAQAILAALFGAYRDDPALLPPEWRPASADPVAVGRAVCDFIAGMTDRYAVRRYEALIGPTLTPIATIGA